MTAVSIRDFRANQSKLIQTVSKMSDFKRFFFVSATYAGGRAVRM